MPNERNDHFPDLPIGSKFDTQTGSHFTTWMKIEELRKEEYRGNFSLRDCVVLESTDPQVKLGYTSFMRGLQERTVYNVKLPPETPTAR